MCSIFEYKVQLRKGFIIEVGISLFSWRVLQICSQFVIYGALPRTLLAIFLA